MFLVIVNKNNVLHELVLITSDRDKAQAQFLDTCSTEITRTRGSDYWDKYTQHDKEALLDMGYEQTGDGAVVLINTDGVTSDAQIAAETGNFLPKNVQKITRWVQSGEIGPVATIDELWESAARCLDGACSWDICGPILFQAEDGNWYTLAVEAEIVRASPAYVEETIAEVEEED